MDLAKEHRFMDAPQSNNIARPLVTRFEATSLPISPTSFDVAAYSANFTQNQLIRASSQYMEALQCTAGDTSMLEDVNSPIDWSFSPVLWPSPQRSIDESPLSSLSSPCDDQGNLWNRYGQVSNLSIESVKNCTNTTYEMGFADIEDTFFQLSAWNETSQQLCSASEDQKQDESYMSNESSSVRSDLLYLKYKEEDVNYSTPKPEPDFEDDIVHPPSSNQWAFSTSHNKTQRSSIIKTTGAFSEHKRRKSSSTTNSTPGDMCRRSTSGNGETESSSKTHSRANHNQVEKKYRNRLNGQFQSLLEVLPKEDDTEEGKKGDKKRIGKAEVLVRAKSHILRLEREKRELEILNKNLGKRLRTEDYWG